MVEGAANSWLIILGAGLVSYLLRAAPVLFFGRGTAYTGGSAFKLLEYAAYTIIGGLISGAIVKPTMLMDFSFDTLWAGIVRSMVIAFAFILSIRIRQPVLCLATSLGFVLLLQWVGVW
jgi:branched-subunit amino acid transport protein